MNTMNKEHSPNAEQTSPGMQKLKGRIKETWGKLTNDDIMLYEGQRDQFMGKLKEHYGIAKEDAEKKMRSLEEACGCATKVA
jgi:uncharacterized protein YjbJ (UPF0337 family)